MLAQRMPFHGVFSAADDTQAFRFQPRAPFLLVFGVFFLVLGISDFVLLVVLFGAFFATAISGKRPRVLMATNDADPAFPPDFSILLIVDGGTL